MVQLVAVLLLAFQAAVVSGVVRDSTGAAIPDAAILIQRAGATPEPVATTGPDGRFTFSLDESRMPQTLIVRAGGFAEGSMPLNTRETGDLQVVLQPAALLETVTVTATGTEQTLIDAPASVEVVTAEDIRTSPAVVADDVLRRVPTFSLFRRTSSLSSHPTSQGVSLRGIGPSGVSRTLVLSDGVAVNDPFGGWVYWSRIPLGDVDRIEVVDSATSSLYGNYAMGGVVNILTRRAAPGVFEATPQYGNRNSPKLDVFGSNVWGRLGVSVDGSAFNTDGFPVVLASERGPIDNNATVKFGSLNGRAEYRASDRATVFARVGYFGENRGNGKIDEVNDTRWTTANGGVRVALPGASELEIHGSGDVERFHSTFMAVTAPSATVPARSIERLSVDQHVPTSAAGFAANWSKTAGRQSLAVGADWHWVDGESQEQGFNAAPGPAATPVQAVVLALNRASGGTQRSAGIFAQDVIAAAPRFTVTVGARFDAWRSYNAHNLETNVPSGTPTANNQPALPDRSDTAVSPRVGAVYHLTDRVNLRGSAGGGFRAPTLNELYRQFRVGTVLTLPNSDLGPERLVGGEAGVDVRAASNVTVRATWFDNRMTDPVSNVTIATSGANVTQQRQNLGKTRAWGFQTDMNARVGADWRFGAAYMFDRATVEEFAASPSLVGNFIPQVPEHRGTVDATYANPRLATIAVTVQIVGRQFDDDQNIRVVPGESTPGLPAYALTDLSISRRIGPNVEVFAGAQNLFDVQYIVGTLPTTIGSPRLVNVGARVRFSR